MNSVKHFIKNFSNFFSFLSSNFQVKNNYSTNQQQNELLKQLFFYVFHNWSILIL